LSFFNAGTRSSQTTAAAAGGEESWAFDKLFPEKKVALYHLISITP
jgi:hypothetical protein